MNNTLAQVEYQLGTPLRGLGPLGNIGSTGSLAPLRLASILSATVGLLTVVAAIWFLFLLLTGAISIMSSGGDKGALEAARKKITTGLIGFVVVISAIFIMDVVTNILNLPNILNIGQMIQILSP